MPGIPYIYNAIIFFHKNNAPMDITPTPEQPFAPPVLTVGPEAQSYLKSAGKWATFLGILGFIFCGIIFILAFFVGSFFTRYAATSASPFAAAAAGAGWVVTFFYLLIDVFYFFFSFYLYQFGSKIKRGITFFDNAHITSAFDKLKSFFKLWGITTIVILALYALFILIAIIVTIAGISAMHS